MTCWSENNPLPLFMLERLRGCSQTQQLCKNNKTASWDIDWSSDVTSSWGWRQEDKNSQWDRALPAPSKLFLTALISTSQFPVFRQPLVIHHLPAFITSSSSFLYSKANSKLPLFFFISFGLEWLSPPPPSLSEHSKFTVFSSSPPGTFFHAHTTTRFL